MAIAALVAFGFGCGGPSLDVPNRNDAATLVELDGASPEGTTALSFRARIQGAPPTGAPWLIRDELSDYHERAVRRADVPQALRERAVPLRYWRVNDECFVQPMAWLEPGAIYTLAWEGLGSLRVLEARSEDEHVALSFFPGSGRAKHGLAVVCDLPDPGALASLTLEPGGMALQPLPEMDGLPRSGCVTLQAAGPLDAALVAPPRVGGALFDPSPWLPAARDTPSVSSCDGLLLEFGCLDVQDDRVFIAGGEEKLWLLQSPRPEAVASVAGARTLLLRGLEPATDVELRGAALASSGKLERISVTLTTAPARRHLILNEVLANPLGAENTGEWIELWNDSERAAWLGDLWLADSGGQVALPDVTLGPGELALLVASGFQPSAMDVPVPATVRLVELPSLATRGLANGGEALRLVGPEGTLSRFPGLAAKSAGHSMARRRPEAADDDPEAFAEHADPGASPGAPNRF